MSEQQASVIVNADSVYPKLAKWKVFVAGAGAGLIVDVSLYPVDTIKSRLQSEQGFIKSGGFNKLYRGLPPVLAGSIPSSSFFFITYETLKEKLHYLELFGKNKNTNQYQHQHLNHIIAASIGEVVACTARVPTEVVKVRSQTTQGKSNIVIAREIILKEGPFGLYRGFISTVIRDTPFSAIQLPIWEWFKRRHFNKYNSVANIYQSAFYGSLAGGVAAFVTTPLDVAKTRIMLANESDPLASGRIRDALRVIWSETGYRGLFAGVVPRMLWISVGAAIWLGSYEKFLDLQSKGGFD